MTKELQKIEVQGAKIRLISKNGQDYISLTDMIKSFGDETIIYNWMRNGNTIEFLGIWEQINNPDFKPVEFDRFKNESGLNRFAMSPKKWRRVNPNKAGNIRDYATIEQLVVLTNLESINAMLIQQNFGQKERLQKLNELAISQMKSLLSNQNIKKLK